MSKKYLIGAGFVLILLGIAAIITWRKSPRDTGHSAQPTAVLYAHADTVAPREPFFATVPITQTVTIDNYFKFIDELVHQYDTLVPYILSEHLLVRANPWLIDTLENTDYYRQIAKGNFVPDQRKMIIMKPGDTIRLPGPQAASVLQSKINSTWLDVNLPAFRLRIVEGDSILYEFPVRIGKNQKKYLAMASGVVDLRTHTGTGEIVRISRHPVFYDPVTGKQFTHTKRDDLKTTRMPLIPWIEPSIAGKRYGQMIHPTTNPRTLGKASSNGCIGLKEADAWRVYYYAPMGTKVTIRYDLVETNDQGDTLRFDDIYRYQVKRKKMVFKNNIPLPTDPANACWCLF